MRTLMGLVVVGGLVLGLAGESKAQLAISIGSPYGYSYGYPNFSSYGYTGYSAWAGSAASPTARDIEASSPRPRSSRWAVLATVTASGLTATDMASGPTTAVTDIGATATASAEGSARSGALAGATVETTSESGRRRRDEGGGHPRPSSSTIRDAARSDGL